MENASKALLIAGGVLLMILLLSFAMFMVRRIGSQSNDLYVELSQSKIDEFNQSFFNYEISNDNVKLDKHGKPINALRIQDVVSILNLASTYNNSQKYPVEVNVNFLGTSNKQKDYNQNELLEEYLKDENSEKPPRFICEVKYAEKYAENSKFVGSVKIDNYIYKS